MAEIEVLGLWQALLSSAENRIVEEIGAPISEWVIKITVAEVLAKGCEWYNPPKVAIIRDTEGRIWILPETAEPSGLQSRYDVRKGMQLSLKIKEVPCLRRNTQAFVVNF